MINIPIYRAKKVDSDLYIQGQYIETEFNNEEYCDIEEQKARRKSDDKTLFKKKDN